MSNPLKQIYDKVLEKDYAVKQAHVRDYYKGDENAKEGIKVALQQVIAAEDEGHFGPGVTLTPADRLAMAVDIYEGEKAASVVEQSKGFADSIANALHSKGVTQADWDDMPRTEKISVASALAKAMQG